MLAAISCGNIWIVLPVLCELIGTQPTGLAVLHFTHVFACGNIFSLRGLMSFLQDAQAFGNNMSVFPIVMSVLTINI